MEYPIRIVFNLAICIIGVFTANRCIQLALLAASFLYHIVLIVTVYNVQ